MSTALSSQSESEPGSILFRRPLRPQTLKSRRVPVYPDRQHLHPEQVRPPSAGHHSSQTACRSICALFFTDCLFIEKRADFEKMIEKALREETEHPRGYHTMQITLVRELLIETHRIFSGEPAAQFRSQSNAILAYIQLHIAEPISRERLQAEFHFHPNYINRLIHRATGMTLHQYIIETRMQKAKELLAFSTLSIAEIAQSLCFYDSSHFSATFQKHTGVTPSFFRGPF